MACEVVGAWGDRQTRHIGSTPYTSRCTSMSNTITSLVRRSKAELRRRKICECRAQVLIGLAQLSVFTLRCLHPLSDIAPQTGTRTAADFVDQGDRGSAALQISPTFRDSRVIPVDYPPS
jgi:hypothetical protein